MHHGVQGISNHSIDEEAYTPREVSSGINTNRYKKVKVVETVTVDSGRSESGNTKPIMVTKQRIAYRSPKK